MARRYDRKLMVVMVALVIPIVVQVQASALPPSSLVPSSLPVLLPHSSEYDEVRDPLHDCLWRKIGICRRRKNDFANFNYAQCVVEKVVFCLRYYKKYTSFGFLECVTYHFRGFMALEALASRLEDCYDKHVRNHRKGDLRMLDP